MAKRADETRKLHPRLRVVTTGGPVGNAVRSDLSTTMACGAAVDPVSGIPTALTIAARLGAPGVTAAAARRLGPRQRRQKRKPKKESFVNVFVELFRERQGVSDKVQRKET